MKKLKRIVSLMLALILVMAAVPSVCAWEPYLDGTFVKVDNFNELLKAVQDSKIEYIEPTCAITISKNIAIPEDVYLCTNYDLTISSGVTVTLEKYASVDVYGTLKLNGTLATVESSYVDLMKGASGSGSITGSGEVCYYDWNDIDYDDKTSAVTYSTLGSVKVGSSVDAYHILSITMDKFSGLKTNPNIYDYASLRATPSVSTLSISKAVTFQDLSLEQHYSYVSKKYIYPKLVVKNGGALTVTNTLMTGAASATVEKGGKITAGTMSVTGGSSSSYPSGSLTIKEGGKVTCDRLRVTYVSSGVTPPSVTNYGTLTVNGSVSNYGNIRSCGTFSHGEVYIYGEGKIYSPFFDTEDGAWYTPQIAWAVKNSITSGIGNGNFGPEQTCTRAQVVTFLWRAAGSPNPKTSNNPFKDVKSSDYFYKAVLWAVENGITNGSDATHFNPNGTCSRAQVVTFLWRAKKEPAPASETNPFEDVRKTDATAWYYDAVLWAVEQEITTGLSQTSFAPNDNCNRAQIVTFLYRSMVG